ncbi:MAG: hypothetical protein HFI93_05405 [Lachnospiraceae bacterium]|nr:hypothetical protein [Lachnospiraceae bacterium]
MMEFIAGSWVLCFFLCATATYIGELVSTLSKAWIPSVFITAIVFLVGYWTFFPQDIGTLSLILPFGGNAAMFLCLTHMGTVISIKQLLEQWKVVVVCLAGLAGMCLFGLVICVPLIGWNYVVAGLPPLTGGIVAATTMMTAAQEAGLETEAVFAIVMYCMQGFAGYPLTAVMLKIEGRALLKKFRAGEIQAKAKAGTMDADNGNLVEEGAVEKKKLIPPVPAKFNSVALMLMKIMFSSYIANQLGALTGLSAAIWALVIAIILTEIGFLDKDILNKAKSYGLVMFTLMIFIFDGLKRATPAMLGQVIMPMIELIIIGVAGMALFCFVAAKILKMNFPMAFATALTALYGFPPNAIITEESCKALAETPEEFDFLMDSMFPQMIVGGFTTVTITSVLIAGAFTSMYK